MFYNVENLFDTFNDSLINDEEFLPQGNRFWNKYKYYSKLNNIYKVIIAVGEWNPPAIIGLCEIENKKVISDLVNNTPLVKFEYKIIHQESPDRRGIDVALLYRDELFSPIYHEAIPINFPGKPESKTRDILYVKGIVKNTDTLDIFINHWPSRWGGQLESEERRVFVASVLKAKVDSIFKSNPKSNIVITGDFNDYPENKSINNILNASQDFDQITENILLNLSSIIPNSKNIGTNKYQGEWGVLDQFIVSGNLLNKGNKMYTSINDIHIFNPDFLLEPDEAYFGYKPKRTYVGYKYNGGFSDHLPIYLILNFNK
jgi:predicted extracellular nuclease